MFKKLFDFFVFSSLFIAGCAVVMVYQTEYLFHLPVLYPLLGFVFFGTLCSYSFHWFLTPSAPSPMLRVQWAQRHKLLHLILFFISGIASAVFLYQLRQHWFWLLASAFITFLYSAPKVPFYPFLYLRKIAVAKTLFLAFVWMHITVLLPILMAGMHFTGAYVLFVLNRFFLIYPICILFDFRDREQDKTEGIRSLITALEERHIDLIFWSCLLVFLLTTIGLYYYQFSLPVLLMLLTPGIILALLYYPSKKNFSDYLYNFILDGLMMLSGLLLLIFKYF